MTTLNFDASSVEPMQPMGALPKGRYDFVIVDTEIKDAKSGLGSYLLVTSDVVGGAMAGRKLFDRFNIVHQNKQAEEIGRRQLAALCQAVGLTRVGDSAELHGKAYAAEVDVKSDEQGESNRIKGYFALAGVAGAAPAAKPDPAAPAAAAKRAPWAKAPA